MLKNDEFNIPRRIFSIAGDEKSEIESFSHERISFFDLLSGGTSNVGGLFIKQGARRRGVCFALLQSGKEIFFFLLRFFIRETLRRPTSDFSFPPRFLDLCSVRCL